LSEERDQPVADEPVEGAPAEGVADEAHAQGDDQPELDEDGNPVEPEPAEEDGEEIELGDAKYKLPKAVAKELREGTLRQADYTRKTQEVAEVRKQLESRAAEITQQAEAQAKTLEARVQLATVEQALKQYGELDWNAYAETYGERAAVVAQAQWRQLETAKSDLQQQITDQENEHRLSSERVTATALQEAHEVLSREVQGYGPELVQKVAQTAGVYGFSPQELRDSLVGADGKADVRSFKILAELAELRDFKAKTEAKNTKAQTAEKVAAVKPAATVKPNAGQYKAGLNDDLPADEWVRRRNAELAKRGR
jgi:hypothetical protein